MSGSRMPEGLGDAGAALWREVLGEFELGPEERPTLLRACRIADTLAELDAIVAEEGVLVPTGRGAESAQRVHPALVEIRAEALLLTRLMASLRLPADDGEQARPARGVYQLRVAR